MSRHRTTAVALLVLLAAWALAGTASGAVPRLIFPVVGKTTYYNDFGAPRPSGGHQGNDLVAAKRTRVVAVERGRVVKYTRSRNAGCMLYLYGRSGTTYMYIHLNNDRTLKNDNRGGCRNGVAFAPGLVSGQQVQAGEHIAFVGDSGDANGIVSHLHFEVHPNGGRAVSPYRHLRRAYRHLYARPGAGDFETMRFRVNGTVVATFLEAEPQRMRVRINRLRLSNGTFVKPARDVTLAVPPEAILRRTIDGAPVAIPLDEFKPGDRVTVWANEFAETLGSARGAAGVHTIRDILLLRRK
ncbi:MAG TPA: M23 family metallopeptidase [Gaiellaceae bacterium]|nr:M23 family metallopeptidase [Gaiellaceae bacterium]